jgi:CheY-like chemotaxis protein
MNIAGRDASHVISRLRDFYRSREETDVFVAVDVNELLEVVVPLTKPKWHNQALETGRTIQLELKMQMVPPVFGNGAELREVLTNLIFNAVDAMPDGGAITLSSAERDGSAVIEIVDTGTGMTEEVRRRCLEPFFSTKAEQGTGLGLAMVFGIIRRHDGTLEIESKVGSGTTIRLTFPRHKPANKETTETRLTLNRSLRVLVVDDEPATLDVVSQYLRSDGHRAKTASGAPEAMKMAVAEQFDVVITDHGMPGMNGVQLATALHRLDASRPIIILTGFAFAAEQQPSFVKCVLKKPLVPAALRSTLQEMLGR